MSSLCEHFIFLHSVNKDGCEAVEKSSWLSDVWLNSCLSRQLWILFYLTAAFQLTSNLCASFLWWNHGAPCELALTDRRERSSSGIMFVRSNWAFILPGISARASERKPTDHEKRDGRRDDRSEVSSSGAGSALRRKLGASLHMLTSEDALVREIKKYKR